MSTPNSHKHPTDYKVDLAKVKLENEGEDTACESLTSSQFSESLAHTSSGIPTTANSLDFNFVYPYAALNLYQQSQSATLPFVNSIFGNLTSQEIFSTYIPPGSPNLSYHSTTPSLLYPTHYSESFSTTSETLKRTRETPATEKSLDVYGNQNFPILSWETTRVPTSPSTPSDSILPNAFFNIQEYAGILAQPCTSLSTTSQVASSPHHLPMPIKEESPSEPLSSSVGTPNKHKEATDYCMTCPIYRDYKQSFKTHCLFDPNKKEFPQGVCKPLSPLYLHLYWYTTDGPAHRGIPGESWETSRRSKHQLMYLYWKLAAIQLLLEHEQQVKLGYIYVPPHLNGPNPTLEIEPICVEPGKQEDQKPETMMTPEELYKAAARTCNDYCYIDPKITNCDCLFNPKNGICPQTVSKPPTAKDLFMHWYVSSEEGNKADADAYWETRKMENHGLLETFWQLKSAKLHDEHDTQISKGFIICEI